MTAKRAADRQAVQVTYRLPSDLVQWISDEAKRLGKPQYELVIEALEEMRFGKIRSLR